MKIGASAFRERFDMLNVSPQRPISHQFFHVDDLSAINFNKYILVSGTNFTVD
jgi:hypothetical protein